MYYVIKGVRYEAMRPKTFGLNVLRDIKKSTGLKPSELGVLFERLKKSRTLEDIIDDEAATLAFSVIIWASRRAAGEQLTMEEACDFDLTTEFDIESTEEERAALLKMAGVPADRAAPDPRKARSRQKSPADKRTGRKAPAKRATPKPGLSTT